jgi:SPOR domain
MSLLNGFNGQQAARPTARPQNELTQGGPAQAQWPQPPQAAQQAQWPQQAPQQGYAPQGYGQAYGTAAPQQGYAPAQGGLSANPDPYAPNFEPYVPAAAPQRAYQPAAQQQSYQPQAAQSYSPQGYAAPDPRAADPRVQANQWPAQQQAVPQQQAGRGFDVGSYLQQQAPAAVPSYGSVASRPHDAEPARSDWSNAHQDPGQSYDFGDAHGGQSNDMGFAQAAGGELEQSYDEEGQDYEVEEPRRGRRVMMIAAALAGAIVVGAGGSYGYKTFFHGGASGNPPMVKSANEPSKTKPADPGGKQFAHTDSKIMGRLGDGAEPATGGAAPADGAVDASGTRKVSTLVVGRDGSIQAPAVADAAAPVATAAAAPAAPAPQVDSGVPGMMVVDALGTKSKTVATTVATAASAAGQQVASAAQTAQKLVVAPPAAVTAPKPINVATAAVPEATGSIAPPAAAAPAVKKVAKKVAAAAPAVTNDAAPVAATSVATGGASGFVAVLASVPRSASSRMDALKRFADMQQKYGNVLGGKTPDVAEANLGAKGAYHRLVVGPPGSREQAGSVCSQLKSQGYADCWVTSY